MGASKHNYNLRPVEGRLTRYKLLAEVRGDFFELMWFLENQDIFLNNITGAASSSHPLYDYVVEFDSTASLERLIKLIRTPGKDWHYMAHTIQPVADYTGEYDPMRFGFIEAIYLD